MKLVVILVCYMQMPTTKETVELLISELAPAATNLPGYFPTPRANEVGFVVLEWYNRLSYLFSYVLIV